MKRTNIIGQKMEKSHLGSSGGRGRDYGLSLDSGKSISISINSIVIF